MSGHSHAKNIARKKETEDKKKSAIFSKLLKAIAIAAKNGDPNPNFNPTLRTAIDKAKTAGVPKDRIDNAINKSTDKSTSLEELIIEAYGPEGAAILITAITDNPNRTLPEIKNLLIKAGAKPADPGSVLWAFSKNNAGSWQAKFPQNLPAGSISKLKNIIAALEEHNDVTSVFTNINL